MKTYREHYKKCVSVSDSQGGGKYESVYDLTVDNTLFDKHLDKNYYNLITKIRNKINEKIEKMEGCFTDKHSIRVNDWNDIKELYDLVDIFMPTIEKDIFGCNAKIEFLHPYRNIPNDSYQFKNEYDVKNVNSSWLWHYDDCPPEFIKLFIHLNEVTKDSGCLKYLKESDGSVPILPSSRPSPGIIGKKVYDGSRIPNEIIEKKLNSGGKVINVTGKSGSYVICTPNIYHRATCPKVGTEPRDVLFFFIRPTIKTYKNYLEKTHSYLPQKNVKQYNLD